MPTAPINFSTETPLSQHERFALGAVSVILGAAIGFSIQQAKRPEELPFAGFMPTLGIGIGLFIWVVALCVDHYKTTHSADVRPLLLSADARNICRNPSNAVATSHQHVIDIPPSNNNAIPSSFPILESDSPQHSPHTTRKLCC